MKQLILIAVILMLAWAIFAGDPNDMPNPNSTADISNIYPTTMNEAWADLGEYDPICIGGHFDDPNALRDWLGRPFFVIRLSCKCEAIYLTKKDFPRKNALCEHKNFFVKIGD